MAVAADRLQAALRAIDAANATIAFGELRSFLTDFDVLLTPTMATPPAELGKLSLSNPNVQEFVACLADSTAFTQLLNASGHPSASIPLHWNAAGLPIRSQLTGRFGDEATLFRLAAELEGAQPWFDRRPPGG